MRALALLLFVAAPALADPPVVAELGGPRPVSLKEALALAARQGPDVLAARAGAAVAAAGVERAWTAWQPDVSATGTYDHTSAPAVLDFSTYVSTFANAFGLTLPPSAAASLPPPINVIAADTAYGTLQVTQPFFTPQGAFLVQPAKAGAEAATRAADDAREQVLLGVARTYLGIQGIDGLLAAARDAETVALQHEAQARAQLQAGTIVEVALLRAQTETAQRRADIANLEGQRASLVPLLAALTGEAITVTPPVHGEAEFGAPASAEDQPWERTPAVASAKAAVQAAEGLVRYDDYRWLPSLAGIAKGNYTSNQGFTGKNWTYDLIVNLSLPLYDHGTRYADLHQDQAKLAQARAQLDSARAKARATWEGARANLDAALAVLGQAKAQADLAARAQGQVEAANKEGLVTSLDLQDADSQRFLAQSALVQAYATVGMRRAEIAAAEGRLFRSLGE